MSVFKEGFYFVDKIQRRSKRLFQDACDFGAPACKNDELWNNAKQLVKWYGVKDSRKVHRYATGVTVEQTVKLVNESNWREQFFLVTFVKTDALKNYDGFFTVSEVK